MRIVCFTASRAAALLFLLVGLVARADFAVLNNLDQPVVSTGIDLFVGQSFLAGDQDQTLVAALMQLNLDNLATSGIELELETRNPDGTVGATLFSDFTSVIDQQSGIITFTAQSPYTLSAGTGYWLVLSGPTVGGVYWDYTESNVYQSALGFALPSFNTAWTSDKNNGAGTSEYYQPSEGPQLFALKVMVPEPSSYLLMCAGLAMIPFALRYKKAQLLRAASTTAKESS